MPLFREDGTVDRAENRRVRCGKMQLVGSESAARGLTSSTTGPYHSPLFLITGFLSLSVLKTTFSYTLTHQHTSVSA